MLKEINSIRPYTAIYADVQQIDVAVRKVIVQAPLSRNLLQEFNTVNHKLTDQADALSRHDLGAYIRAAIGSYHYGNIGLPMASTPVGSPKWTPLSWYYCIGGLTSGRIKSELSALMGKVPTDIKQLGEEDFNKLVEHMDMGMPILFKTGQSGQPTVYSGPEIRTLEQYYEQLDLEPKEKAQIIKGIDDALPVLNKLTGEGFLRCRLFNNQALRYGHSPILSEEDRARLDLASLPIWVSLQKNVPLFDQMKRQSLPPEEKKKVQADFETWYLENEFEMKDRMTYFIYQYKAGLIREIRWHETRQFENFKRFTPENNNP